jgi:hypothetical protein
MNPHYDPLEAFNDFSSEELITAIREWIKRCDKAESDLALAQPAPRVEALRAMAKAYDQAEQRAEKTESDRAMIAADRALRAGQKPVAEVRRSGNGSIWIDWYGTKTMADYVGSKFYAHPPEPKEGT